MCDDELSLEREALGSLFSAEEFTEEPDGACVFRLRPPDEVVHVGATLRVSCPADYPAALPDVELLDSFGLDEQQQGELLLELQRCAEESRGAPMIYDVCEAASSWLRCRNTPPVASMYDAMLSAAAAGAASPLVVGEKKAEEGEPEGSSSGTFRGLDDNLSLARPGEQATTEEFQEWLAAFSAEMIAAGEWKIHSRSIQTSLTGRQLFEINAAVFEEEEDAEEIEDIEW